MNLIDKSALVAEIESKKKYAQTLGDNAINGSMQQFYDGMKQGCVDILSFIDSLEEEPVNEDLEKAASIFARKDSEEISNPANFYYTVADKVRVFKAGAKWKEEEMQSIIELAEDHAMFAGMEKMKEQLMTKAIDAEVKIDAGNYPYIPQIELYNYDKDIPLAKEGDRYKVILVKED